MAIRNDLTVDWGVSPRIITVAAPATELTCQDLLDTLRNEESLPTSMAYPSIVDAAGGESLGGGTSVGLTVTLQNALVAFEARAGAAYEQCNVNGGNLVALQSDLSTYYVTPISPTAFTQVVTTASSSATSQNQASIEYGSFEGAVWYDATDGSAGTGGLQGNAQNPVDNMSDTVTIRANRGLPKVIEVIGDITLDTGDNVEDYELRGVSHINSVVTVNAGAETLRTSFTSFDITGVLDGGSEVKDCVVRDLTYFNGHIHDSYLAGEITLSGSLQANISDCKILDVLNPPTVNAGGSGQNLMMPNFSGRMNIVNLTGSSQMAIGLDAGEVIIDSSCTSGVIAVSGSGRVIDNSGAGCYVIDTTTDGTELHNIRQLVELQRPSHSALAAFTDSRSAQQF